MELKLKVDPVLLCKKIKKSTILPKSLNFFAIFARNSRKYFPWNFDKKILFFVLKLWILRYLISNIYGPKNGIYHNSINNFYEFLRNFGALNFYGQGYEILLLFYWVQFMSFYWFIGTILRGLTETY